MRHRGKAGPHNRWAWPPPRQGQAYFRYAQVCPQLFLKRSKAPSTSVVGTIPHHRKTQAWRRKRTGGAFGQAGTAGRSRPGRSIQPLTNRRGPLAFLFSSSTMLLGGATVQTQEASIGVSKTAQTRWLFCIAVATLPSKAVLAGPGLHCPDVQNHLSARASITPPMSLQVL